MTLRVEAPPDIHIRASQSRSLKSSERFPEPNHPTKHRRFREDIYKSDSLSFSGRATHTLLYTSHGTRSGGAYSERT